MKRNPFIYRTPKTRRLSVVSDKMIHGLIRKYAKHLNASERQWLVDTMKLQFVTIKSKKELIDTIQFFIKSARTAVTVGVGKIPEMKYLYEFLRDEKIKANVMRQGDLALVTVSRADIKEYMNVIPGGPRPIGEDMALLLTSAEGETDKMLAMAQALIGVGVPVFILAWKPGQMAIVTAKQEVNRAKDILKQSAQFAKALGLPGQPTTFRYNPLTSQDMSGVLEEMQSLLERAQAKASTHPEEAKELSWRLSQLASTAQGYMDPEMPQEWQDRYRQKTMYYMRMASGIREKTGMSFNNNPRWTNDSPYWPTVFESESRDEAWMAHTALGKAGIGSDVISVPKVTNHYVRIYDPKKFVEARRVVAGMSGLPFANNPNLKDDPFFNVGEEVTSTMSGLHGIVLSRQYNPAQKEWEYYVEFEMEAQESETILFRESQLRRTSRGGNGFNNNPWLIAGPQVGFTDTLPGDAPAQGGNVTPIPVDLKGDAKPHALPLSGQKSVEGKASPKSSKRPVSDEERSRRHRAAMRQRKDPKTGKFYDNPNFEEYRPNSHANNPVTPSAFVRIADVRGEGQAHSTVVKYDQSKQMFTVRYLEEKDGERVGLEVDVQASGPEAARMWRYVKKNGFTEFLKALKKANRSIHAKRAYKEAVRTSVEAG